MASEVVKFRGTSAEQALEFQKKAVSIESYLHKAGNFEQEREAASERLRAERFVGTELRKIEKPKGGRGNLATEWQGLPDWYSEISKHQRRWWEVIAYIPDKKFEEYLADPKKGVLPSTQRAESGIPTTKGLVTLGKPYKQAENRKLEQPERKKSAEELRKIEERKAAAAEKAREKRIKKARSRSSNTSERLITRAFALILEMTPQERARLLQMLEDRADELVPAEPV